MGKSILAKKIEMTQMFDESGKVIPVTLLEAGPVFVTQIKLKERDGYEAVQVGFGAKKKLGLPAQAGEFRWLREFRDSAEGLNAGDRINVSVFEKGDVVDVTGYSKGRGFQGVVKRHGFHGGPKTHGTKHSHRAPGSIGATHPQHVIKGKRMAGHMGMRRVTTKNLTVIDVDPEKNTLSVKGAVPGSRGTLVMIKSVKEKKG